MELFNSFYVCACACTMEWESGHIDSTSGVGSSVATNIEVEFEDFEWEFDGKYNIFIVVMKEEINEVNK